jgi:hypothetical protein
MIVAANQQFDPPRDSMWLLFAIVLARHNLLGNSLHFGRIDIPLASDLNKTAGIISRRQKSLRLMVRKIMKNLLPLLLAVLIGIACFIPAPASAYRYHGRYYPYYYGGHYYRYRYQGHYYQYQNRGHYYRHRGWVVGVSGRPGYYRYW